MTEKREQSSRESKNILLLGFSDVLYNAFCRLGLKPKVWIRPGKEHIQINDSGTLVLHHSPLKFANLPAAYSKSLSLESARKVFDKAYPFFLRNFNKQTRCPFYYGTSWQDKENRLRMMINYYHHLLDEKSIDCIIFCSPPHGGSDIALYFLAKELKIKTLVSIPGIFTKFTAIVQDIDDLGIYRTSIPGSPHREISINQNPAPPYYMDIGLPKLYKYSDSRIKIASRIIMTSLAIPYYFSISAFSTKNVFYSKVRNLCVLMQRIRMIHKMNTLKFDPRIMDDKFVYFPLHFQPEATGETLGWDYADQLLAIEDLRRRLPENIAILVKENPLQSTYAREESFFNRLQSIPNTHYVPPHIDTYTLIKRSMAVATLLGTAGWEALQMGRPVICFGLAWYRSLPGCYIWSSDFSWKDVEKFRFDLCKLRSALHDMSRHFHSGLSVHKGFDVAIPDFDPNKDAELYVNAIKRYL